MSSARAAETTSLDTVLVTESRCPERPIDLVLLLIIILILIIVASPMSSAAFPGHWSLRLPETCVIGRVLCLLMVPHLR
jgi:hypothetical protein